MAGLDDLSRGELQGILKRLRILESAAPLQNASIGEGGLRVHSGGQITIQNGGLSVTGTATISGVLNADGTVTLSGTVGISGPLTISGNTSITGNVTSTGTFTNNGPTNLNGATKTTGTLSVEGVTTLKNDLNVTGAGKIIAGQTTIRPSGAINFGDTLTIHPADEFGPAGISDGLAKYTLTPGGGNYFHQFQGGIYVNGRINGMDMILSDLPTTSSPANLYIDPSTGVLKRSTAA